MNPTSDQPFTLTHMEKSKIPVCILFLFFLACTTGPAPVPTTAELDPASDKAMTELVDAMLRAELNASDVEAGSIAILDVSSGKPLVSRGIARKESGDLQIADELVNSVAVEHGSIMMLPVLMIGMADQKIQLAQHYGRNGGEYDLNGVLMRDPATIYADSLTLAEAFVQRSNVVVAKAITQAYPNNGDRIYSRLREAELLQDDLRDTDRLPWVTIGYEAKQTPLQVLQWYRHIANAQLDGIKATKEMDMAHDLLVRSAIYLSSNGVVDTFLGFAGQIGLVQTRGTDGRQKYRTVFVGYYPAAVPRRAFLISTERPTTAGYSNAEVTMRIIQRLIATFE